MKIKIFRSARGFTLIEVLFSIGILAFTVCGLLVSYTSAMVLTATPKNINSATNAAMGLMEKLRTDTYSQIVGDYDGLVFYVNAIPTSVGVVVINATNPELLNVTISVCWQQGNRVIGEDKNLDGNLDPEEDLNNDSIIDSPVELVTLMADR